MSKKILITGSGGLIGSEAVNFFGKDGFEVLGIDNNMRAYYFGSEGSTEGNVKKHQQRFKNYQHFNCDIREEKAVEEIFKANVFDLIIHTAAQPSHDWAAKEPLTDFNVNANGTLILLENFRKYSPDAVFIFTSTNKVYGDAPNLLPLIEQETRWEIDPHHKYKNGIAEDMQLDNSTHSLFGVSKAAADLMVQEYGRYFGLKTGVFRGGCLTGSGHSGVQQHGFLSYLVKCILTNRTYSIFGYKAKQVRDNIHAHDLINAFYHFYKNPRPGEVYNIGGSRFANVSIKEAIKKIEDLSGQKAKTEYVDQNRIGDHIWYVSNVDKFKSHYPGWKYEYDIDKTIDDICKNSAFAKKVFAISVEKNLDFWRDKNWYFHNSLAKLFKQFIPKNKNILQVGYGLGDILAILSPKKAVSIDANEHLVNISSKRFPAFKFMQVKFDRMKLEDRFDYLIFPNSVDHFDDIQSVLMQVHSNLRTGGKIIVSSINPRWEYFLKILEKFNFKRKEGEKNWLRLEDLANVIEISGYKVINRGFRLLLPTNIPFISDFINNLTINSALLSRFGVQQYLIAEKQALIQNSKASVSFIIPTTDSDDYINLLSKSMSQFRKKTEIVIVDQGRKNALVSKIKLLAGKNKRIKLVISDKPINVGQAINQGFKIAKGDILITLDDKTFPTIEDLNRLIEVIVQRQARFANATRHIYHPESQPFRQLHILGNLVFSWLFSFLLGQRVTDLLCGVKAFNKRDLKKIQSSQIFFGNYSLVINAASQHLKIREVPIHNSSDFAGYTISHGLNRTLTLVYLLLNSLFEVVFWANLRKLWPPVKIKKSSKRHKVLAQANLD